MLTSIKGTFRHGQVELPETPVGVRDETPVIVTFLSSDVDLTEQKISPAEAAELRAALACFGDWKDPQMDAYDDYDTAKTEL